MQKSELTDETNDAKAWAETYDATSSDEIQIIDDKLWRYLKEYEKPIKLIAYLTSSFTIGLALLTTLLSSDFKTGQSSFLFSSATWAAIFLAGLAISTIVFLAAIGKALYLIISKKWITTDSLIKKIKSEARKMS